MPEKQQKIVLLCFVALFVGHNAQPANGLCTEYSASKKACLACYRSKIDPQTGKCGQILPESDVCLIYNNPATVEFSGCLICKEGYANKFTDSRKHLNCVKDPNYVENCFDEAFVHGGRKFCQACKGGIPSADDQTCLTWSQVKNPIKNCLVAYSEMACVQCANGLTFNFETNQCQALPGLTGCLSAFIPKNASGVATGGYECRECNFYAGYQMDDNLNCVKP